MRFIRTVRALGVFIALGAAPNKVAVVASEILTPCFVAAIDAVGLPIAAKRVAYYPFSAVTTERRDTARPALP